MPQPPAQPVAPTGVDNTMRAVRRTAVLFALLFAAFAPSVADAGSPPPFAVLADFSPANDFADAGAIATGPDGNVYVVRFVAAGQRVDVFTGAGVLVRTIGAPGPNPGQFSSARDVDVDLSGGVYVTESDRVQKFDAGGALIDPNWGGRPVGSLAAGGEQVATIVGQQLRRLTRDGALITDQASPAGKLAMDAAGIAYVAGGQGLFAITASGARRTIGMVGPLGRSAYPDEFSSSGPTNVVVTPGGDLYVNDRAEHRLIRFRADGTYLATCGQARFDRQLEARSLATTPDGTLLVVDGGVVRRFGAKPVDARDGCLDQFVSLSRPSVKAAEKRGRSSRVLLRSTVRAVATVRVYRLTSSSKSRALRRVQRRVQTLRAGTTSVPIRALRPGRYRITVDASDAYGNVAARRVAILKIGR